MLGLYLFMKTLLVVFGVDLTCRYDKTLRYPRYKVGREKQYNSTVTSSVQKKNGIKETTGHFRKNEEYEESGWMSHLIPVRKKP